MALAAWKRLERTPGYQRKKLILKRLAGKELRLRPALRISTAKLGGWWFHPDTLDGGSVVWSLGVGEDVEFDLGLIRRYGLSVHAFDPTPSSIDWLAARSLPAGFHFHPWAVTAEDGEISLYPRVKKDGSKSTTMFTLVPEDSSRGDAITVPAFSLQSVSRKLGQRAVDLLKMDIEGAEYEVLDSLLQSSFRPRQLLVEFHHRFAGIDLGKTRAMIGRLIEGGYELFAVSETGRELSFMHRERQGPAS